MRIMPRLLKSAMRSPKGNHRPGAVTAIILLFACSLYSFYHFDSFQPKKLYGTWQYTSVMHDGKIVFEIGQSDTMNLERSGQFNYVIAKPGKNAKGTWQLISVPKDSSTFRKALELTYEPNG